MPLSTTCLAPIRRLRPMRAIFSGLPLAAVAVALWWAGASSLGPGAAFSTACQAPAAITCDDLAGLQTPSAALDPYFTMLACLQWRRAQEATAALPRASSLHEYRQRERERDVHLYSYQIAVLQLTPAAHARLADSLAR